MRKDIGGPVHVGRAVEPEADVMQAAVATLDEGDIVRGAGSLEEGRELVTLGRDDLFGEAEAKDFAVEPSGFTDVLAGEQAVVEALGRDAHQIERHRRRIHLGQPVSDLLHAVVEHHRVAARASRSECPAPWREDRPRRGARPGSPKTRPWSRSARDRRAP